MTAAGVAAAARTGRLIDRFRDRVVIPIVHEGETLGFVARRNPALGDDDKAGPKYLNTADTTLFHKGAQVFGLVPELDSAAATLVLVEGPLDAWAVTLATGGRHIGLAPLGTSLTDEQAAQMAALGRPLVVASDADLAGRVAAERDYWLLTQHGLDPGAATFPAGLDPAGILARDGAAALERALVTAKPLGDLLLEERLTHLAGEVALRDAAHVLAARPEQHWIPGIDAVASRLTLPPAAARSRLAASVLAWNRDPRASARARLDETGRVKDRLTAALQEAPTQRWAALAAEVDPRLISQTDWPALAAMMQLAHNDGHDVPATVRRLVEDEPLADLPAQDLRYRLVATLPIDVAPSAPPTLPARPPVAGKEHADRALKSTRRPGPRPPRR